MESSAAWSAETWSAESRAALEAVAASAAELAALTRAGVGRSDAPGADPLCNADPLRSRADGCLDGLAEVAGWRPGPRR